MDVQREWACRFPARAALVASARRPGQAVEDALALVARIVTCLETNDAFVPDDNFDAAAERALFETFGETPPVWFVDDDLAWPGAPPPLHVRVILKHPRTREPLQATLEMKHAHDVFVAFHTNVVHNEQLELLLESYLFDPVPGFVLA